MPKGGGGPRQPLSRRRPGKAAAKPPATAKGAKAKGKRAGGPPPKPTMATSKARRTTALSPVASKSRTRPRPLTGDALRSHAARTWDALAELYPDAHCELDYQSPWQLLVATILSAQCTDKRVNMVTPVLFARWSSPAALAVAPPADVEDVIKSTGFFRAKAKSILGAASAIVERHAGEVPPRMEDLVVLPGVGRKTANVVLGNAFGINEGIVVDTHVGRLATRLGLTSEVDPVKVEQALMPLFPRERWTLLSHLLIWHGRRLCDARKPRCTECPLRASCPASLAPVVSPAPGQ